MNFLKKRRKEKLLIADNLAKATGINRASISAIENDLEKVGEDRAKLIGGALGIQEDVMMVYRGHLPEYAKDVYKTQPDKLERSIKKAIKKLEQENSG